MLQYTNITLLMIRTFQIVKLKLKFTRQIKCSDIQAAKGSPLGQILADGPQSEIASDQIYTQSRKR